MNHHYVFSFTIHRLDESTICRQTSSRQSRLHPQMLRSDPSWGRQKC